MPELPRVPPPPRPTRFVQDDKISTERAGVHAVGSWALTGEQLDTIVDALEENSPRRVEWFALVVSVANFGVFADKVIRASLPETELRDDITLTVVACALVGLICQNVYKACIAKHRTYTRALGYARELADSKKQDAERKPDQAAT